MPHSQMSLQVEHVSAGYRNRTVLDDLSLGVARGEIVGLLGPNGAGKSTLIRVISGTLRPLAGKVALDGEDLGRLAPAARARRIAVVPQSGRLPETFRVGEVVLMGRTPHLSFFAGERARDWIIAEDAMAKTNTLGLAERFVGELSGGEQQRVLVARALAQEPQVLLLDEATAHLDLRHQFDLLRLARQLARAGLIVLAALHDVNLAGQFADRIALLQGGRLLICDEPKRVLTPAWIRRAYDVSVVISSHPRSRAPLVALALDGEAVDCGGEPPLAHEAAIRDENPGTA